MKASGALLFKSLKGLVDITVETIAERDAMLTYRRRWGMVVAVYNDGANNGHYILEKGLSSDILADNANWTKKDLHDRLHAINSPEDHAPAEGDNRGRYVRAHPETGHIGFSDIGELSEVEIQKHTITISADGATTFNVPENIGFNYVSLNGIVYNQPDYTLVGTQITWGDTELETDDELIMYYQTL